MWTRPYRKGSLATCWADFDLMKSYLFKKSMEIMIVAQLLCVHGGIESSATSLLDLSTPFEGLLYFWQKNLGQTSSSASLLILKAERFGQS